MSRTSTPGAVPRGCYAVYRGNLGGDPKSIDRDRPFASARMGVNMAAPDVGAEERDQTDRVGEHHRLLRRTAREAAQVQPRRAAYRPCPKAEHRQRAEQNHPREPPTVQCNASVGRKYKTPSAEAQTYQCQRVRLFLVEWDLTQS